VRASFALAAAVVALLWPAPAHAAAEPVVYTAPARSTVAALARDCHASAAAIRALNRGIDEVDAGDRIRLPDPERVWTVRKDETLTQVGACTGHTPGQLLADDRNARYRSHPHSIDIGDEVAIPGVREPAPLHAVPRDPDDAVRHGASMAASPAAARDEHRPSAGTALLVTAVPTLTGLVIGLILRHVAVRRGENRGSADEA
jgi:hypothetical protein